MSEKTITTKMPVLPLTSSPDGRDEEVREALLLLAQRGYQIIHDGSRLVLTGKRTWGWTKL